RTSRSLTATASCRQPQDTLLAPKFPAPDESGTQRADVHLDTRTHGGRDRQPSQVDTLGRRRLQLVQIADQRLQVLPERGHIEAGLADRAVDNARLVGTVAHLTGLGV